MENMARCLEIDGSRTIKLDMMRGVYREHLFAEVDSNGVIFIEVDDYNPSPESEWDGEEWEEHKCFLSGQAMRHNWKILFRIARGLARHGKVVLYQPGKEPMEIVCDRRSVTIN